MSRRRHVRAGKLRPLDRERALARFRNLVGRNVTFGFVPYGPLVDAETPEQLAEAVACVLADATTKERPS